MTVSKNQGVVFSIKRLTVNLAPADLLKQSPAYDLPMAVGILWAPGQVSSLSSSVFIGEPSFLEVVGHVPNWLQSMLGKGGGIALRLRTSKDSSLFATL